MEQNVYMIKKVIVKNRNKHTLKLYLTNKIIKTTKIITFEFVIF